MRPAPLCDFAIRALSIAAISLVIRGSTHAQADIQASADGFILTSAVTALGTPSSHTTVPGTLPATFGQFSGSGLDGPGPFDASAYAQVSAGRNPANPRANAIATVSATANVSSFPATANALTVVPVRFDVSFAAPAYASLRIRRDALQAIGGFASYEVDIFDDGTIDHSSTSNETEVTVPLPDGILSVAIRVVAIASAGPNGSAGAVLNLTVMPRAACPATTIAEQNCDSAFHLTFPLAEFDGGIRFRAQDRPLFEPFLAIGFQQISAPIPLPLSFGNCLLEPTLDVVIRFPTVPEPMSGLVAITLPTPPSSTVGPLSFYVQGIGIDLAANAVGLSRAFRLDCP